MPANPSPDVEWVRVLQDSWELRKHDHDGCMNHHWWDVPWCISFPCQHTRTRSVRRRNCLFMRCVTLVLWSSDTLSIFDPQQHKLNPTTTEHHCTLDTWTCSQDVLADIIRNSFIWNISRWLTAQWLSGSEDRIQDHEWQLPSSESCQRHQIWSVSWRPSSSDHTQSHNSSKNFAGIMI